MEQHFYPVELYLDLNHNNIPINGLINIKWKLLTNWDKELHSSVLSKKYKICDYIILSASIFNIAFLLFYFFYLK